MCFFHIYLFMSSLHVPVSAPELRLFSLQLKLSSFSLSDNVIIFSLILKQASTAINQSCCCQFVQDKTCHVLPLLCVKTYSVIMCSKLHQPVALDLFIYFGKLVFLKRNLKSFSWLFTSAILVKFPHHTNYKVKLFYGPHVIILPYWLIDLVLTLRLW